MIIDGDLTKPTPVSPKRWERSFDDDPNFYVYEQDFQQLARLFQVAKDYPFEVVSAIGQKGKVSPFTNALHRCVAEGPLVSIGGGVIQWTRTYARTPATRNVWESYNWKAPGIATAGESELLVINAASSSQGGAVTTIVTTAVHGLTTGDYVSITYNAVVSAGVVQRSQLRVVTVTNTTTFTVAKILDDIETVGGVLSWRNVQRGITRVPLLHTVQSKSEVKYYAVGENTIKGPEDIPIIETDTILDSDGAETDTYSPTTLPTAATYRASTGKWIVAENSIVRVWKGNIYERSTRYVRAK